MTKDVLKQEPVAWVTGLHAGRCVIRTVNPAAILPVGIALYTHPAPAVRQEPVAWMHVAANMPSNRHLEWNENHPGYRGDWIKHPLYTIPPAAHRLWIGLTDEDVTWLCNTAKSHEQTWGMFVRATEAKLKEKNGL